MSQASSSYTVLESGGAAACRAVFVDLDGTLIDTDLLAEMFFQAIKNNPALAAKVPFWLLQGRAEMKCRLAELPFEGMANLPYREEVLARLKQLKQEGGHLVLATASPRALADQVAQELGLFGAVLATDPTCNLKGKKKLQAIETYCREHGFEEFAYFGDSLADIPIWEKATKVLAVAPSARLKVQLKRLGDKVEIVVASRRPWKAYVRALRPHQWSKNLLVFVPTILAHDLSLQRLLWALVAFVSFSACASAVYLTNDLLDLQVDRLHPHKRKRPFASGELSQVTAIWLAPVLVLLGFALSLATASWMFPVLLGAYVVTSALYSVWLKRLALVDVFLLSGLYILRIQAGGSAAGVPVSEWMLIFSLFFFLSLAFAKRFVELDLLELAADDQETGRGYRTMDVHSISSMGPTSGYIAVLVLALYINSPQVILLYARPKALLMLCPIVLFWVNRLWLLARRHELHDDPLVFALQDRTSLLLGLLSVATVVLAWLMK
jgi:4-hydroxybenzoate polyprenyltransferase/phosphoserine phosphatase